MFAFRCKSREMSEAKCKRNITYEDIVGKRDALLRGTRERKEREKGKISRALYSLEGRRVSAIHYCLQE